MNKRQYKKNIRKQTMTLSRSELARHFMQENHKRRLQCLNYAIRVYSNKINKWPGPGVYKHFKYPDHARGYIINQITESQQLSKLWRIPWVNE